MFHVDVELRLPQSTEYVYFRTEYQEDVVCYSEGA
jgi:hypothetical protein